jgi:hypothetical protein
VFIASEDDIVDRRYRIVRIAPSSVEVEDMLNKHPGEESGLTGSATSSRRENSWLPKRRHLRLQVYGVCYTLYRSWKTLRRELPRPR